MYIHMRIYNKGHDRTGIRAGKRFPRVPVWQGVCSTTQPVTYLGLHTADWSSPQVCQYPLSVMYHTPLRYTGGCPGVTCNPPATYAYEARVKEAWAARDGQGPREGNQDWAWGDGGVRHWLYKHMDVESASQTPSH